MEFPPVNIHDDDDDVLVESKLRFADLRKQFSSSKDHRSRSEEDLALRLQSKLEAANYKRLSILENARLRLARLDDSRQATKTRAAMQYEEGRNRIASKLELRLQQAEKNRMLILKAYSNRRATLNQRSSQFILQRMARETKYKECVSAAIHRKRAAAENKRFSLLDAKKIRARARALQVWRFTNQKEIERRQMKDKLEDRLQRARTRRAEYLRQRGMLCNPLHSNHNKIHKQEVFLSIKLARCWRRFLRQRKTTLALATTYNASQVNEKRVKSMPFEQLALLIESTAIVQAMKALLDRFESRIRVSQIVSATSNIDHLLKRVVSPRSRHTPKNSTRNAAKLSRYQVRVVLCAYMILGHPDTVFNGQGEHEFALAKSAEKLVTEFELLLKLILEGPLEISHEESHSSSVGRLTFRSQLAAFDKSWCSYLSCFVAWKVKDTTLLEEDFVRAACNLELSMMQTCKLTSEGDSGILARDMKAVQKQVTEDQKLLREKVEHLSGNDGIERMECALVDTRTKYFESREKVSPLQSPILSSDVPSPVACYNERNTIDESIEREISSSLLIKAGFSPPTTNLNLGFGSSGEQLVVENEMIVNEVVHGQHYTLADSFDNTVEDQHGIKAKMKEVIEKAFWDGIIESMEQDEPKYDRIFELIVEVRDDLCEMAPQSWKQEIHEAIDVDILSQVMKMGNLDITYLGKILDFALVTLQRLSTPAKDNEMNESRQKLLKEIVEICQGKGVSNHSLPLIKGLQFVLEQVQILKREISKARIGMTEPFLKGPAGLEYLKNVFSNRYGSPSDVITSLPLTMQWISSAWNCKDEEWTEHQNSITGLTNHVFLPSTSLRTGGSLLAKSSGSQLTSRITGTQDTEFYGERIDLLVRLGLLNLVCGVSGVTHESLPETLKLNLFRLRAVQAEIQKVIVISTSTLIFRQILLTEQAISNPTTMESTMLDCITRLSELLDHVEDAGIEEIVETIVSWFSVDNEKYETRKMVMKRMVVKSLQAEDAVFKKVARAVYLSLRGVVLGGNGAQGCKLAETALGQVGVAALATRVVKAAQVIMVVASVSVKVHGSWYLVVAENMV